MLRDGVEWAQLLLEVLRELLLLLSQHWNGPILVSVLLKLIVGHGAATRDRTSSNWMGITLESPLRMRIVHLIEAVEAVRSLSLTHLAVSWVVCTLCGAATGLKRIWSSRMQLLVRLPATSRRADATVMGTLASILQFILYF